MKPTKLDEYLHKEILGKEFINFWQYEYDESRRYLKNAGKPEDEYDRYMIDFHRETVRIASSFITAKTLN